MKPELDYRFRCRIIWRGEDKKGKKDESGFTEERKPIPFVHSYQILCYEKCLFYGSEKHAQMVLDDPNECSKYVKKVKNTTVKKSWKKIKLEIQKEKFRQNPRLINILMNTDDKFLTKTLKLVKYCDEFSPLKTELQSFQF